MTRKLALLMSAPIALGTAMAAQASDYPTQSIDVIVPYSAGGGGDTVARIVTDRLAEELGVSINVVNREGAGGEIGISEMASADPDGYTLGVFGYPDNFVIESTRDVDFTSDDLDYLAQFDSMPMGVFASPNASFDDLDGLQEHATDHPGELIIGESGALGLLNILAFQDQLDITLTDVRYSGGGELMNAILGDHIDLASTSSMSHDPITDAGGTPIGFTANERMDMFPDVPTFQEQGVDLTMGVSRVMVAPAGIPDDVRDTLTDALDAISEDEEMIDNFLNASLPYNYLGYDDVNQMVADSNEVFAAVIEENRDQFEDE